MEFGVHDYLLIMDKKRTYRCYGLFSRSPDIAKTVLLGTVKRARCREKDRRRDGENGQEVGLEKSLRAAEGKKMQHHLWRPNDRRS